MTQIWRKRHDDALPPRLFRAVSCVLIAVFLFPFDLVSLSQLPDSIPLGEPLTRPSEVVGEEFRINNDSLRILQTDTIPVDLNEAGIARADSVWKADHQKLSGDDWVEVKRTFNPNPNRAVWLSALFPGLGQIYNRRYWKLPLVIGGYMGLGYATSWNNGMLNDYTRAYQDIMDNDPSTNSYMNFFPSTTKEEDLDRQWLENILKSRKNYFRRNRDMCIICMVGLYLIAMVDAYVDASLSHFDITPDLSLQWAPTLIQDSRGVRPSVGLNWALTF